MNLLDIEGATPITCYRAFIYASVTQNWCQNGCGQFSNFSDFLVVQIAWEYWHLVCSVLTDSSILLIV